MFCKGQGEDEVSYEDIGNGRIVVHFCAFLILQHLIPGLEAHTFYMLVMGLDGRENGVLRDVDYGPVGDIHESEVEWRMVADIYFFDGDLETSNLEPGERDWWLKLLTQEDKTDEEILEDAWMGWGNMWVFKHPGLFPIAEAIRLADEWKGISSVTLFAGNTGRPKVPEATSFLAFPPELMEVVFGYLSPRDVLASISTATALYRRFRTSLDRLTHSWIRRQRPWYLPDGPIPCEAGDTEMVRWKKGWGELGDLEGGVPLNEREIPWFVYYLACKGSLNIRSRKRIWNVVLQIKELLASTLQITIYR